MSENEDNSSEGNSGSNLISNATQTFKEFYEEVYHEEIHNRAELYEGNEEDYLWFPLDFALLQDYDENLARGLTEKPDVFFDAAERALQNYDDIETLESVSLRITNHSSETSNIVPIRQLRAKDVNRMVSIEGIIKKTTNVLPKVSLGAFECKACGAITYKQQDTKYLEKPDECSNDSSHSNFDLIYRESEIIDYQKITVQEPPENLQGGETPQAVDVFITGALAGETRPGQRVTVTGVLRADVEPKSDTPVFDTYINGIMVTPEQKEFEEVEISDEDQETIKEYAQRDDIYELLTRSIAPSIYGYDKLKKATVYQLFSGVSKDMSGSHRRGDIHILYIGDPGTAKSQLLQYVKKIAPRAVYTVGQGSSSAGLTATAVQETDVAGDQKWTLEAGALVLADKGIACVDEVDKMDAKDRSSLHEALEQQQVSVAKAGINATLKSRCSMLAAANPKEGRFDPYGTLSEQIDLEPALISRFDLIFKVLDEPSEEKDAELAEHVIESSRLSEQDDRDESEIQGETIPPELLQKYVAYARKNVKPTLTQEVESKIKNFYVDQRNKGDDETIPFTARALEALIRLAEASAKVRLAEEVTKNDAQRAIDIMMDSLEEVSMDPETKRIDADKIESSVSTSQRSLRKVLRETIKDLEGEEGQARKETVIETVVEDTSHDEDRVDSELDKLRTEGDVIEPELGYVKYIG